MLPTNRLLKILGSGLILAALTEACSPAPSRPKRNGPVANSNAAKAENSQSGGTPEPTGIERPTSAECLKVSPGKSQIRRLTRFEYNNTMRDLFGDTSLPASALPAEELGNGFGNDAATLSVSSLLAKQYGVVADRVADKAFKTPATLVKFLPCAMAVTAAGEEACLRTFLKTSTPKMYRRPATAEEIEQLVTLFKAIRPAAADFPEAIAAVTSGILQSPEFLYKVELGDSKSAAPEGQIRPSSYEMATRLSYLFWGTMPDQTLMDAAASGSLLTAEGVGEQAKRLLEDERSHEVVRYFFENLLPINGLTDLERDKTLYPNFSKQIGSLMYQETQKFLEYIIYEGTGSWSEAFSAPYTFLNSALAKYYGIDGVTGDTFQKVALDGKTRLGLLTQGGFLAGSTNSSTTSPVIRGAFVARNILCQTIPLPGGDLAAAASLPPAPESAKTARQRFTAHSAAAVCATCHKMMDPLGLTFENYDAVGAYRTKENGETIDASGMLPSGLDNSGPVLNAIELSQRLAKSADVQTCFVNKWMSFAYGKTLIADDACTKSSMEKAFKDSGYNVRQMLLNLTQTDAFLYRSITQP